MKIQVYTNNSKVLYVDINPITTTMSEFEESFKKEYSKENNGQKFTQKNIEFYFFGNKIDNFLKLKEDDLIYLNDKKFKELFELVEKFCLNKKLEKYDFPTTLNSNERRFIHSISEYFNIFTESKGKNQNRFIQLSKNEFKKKKDNIPEGYSEILNDFLYLGSGKDALNYENLKKNNIKNVLNLTEEWPILKKSNLNYKRIPLKDVKHQNIIDCFEEAIQFINEIKLKKEKILVHCVIGKSRSASFIIAYLMKENELNLNDSFKLVQSKREFIKPNDGFIKQLMNYESILFKSINSSLEWNFNDEDILIENFIKSNLSNTLLFDKWKIKSNKNWKNEIKKELESLIQNDKKLNQKKCYKESIEYISVVLKK
eukprot:gene1638-12763_t